ncbi:hypothetical protein PR202_gb05028 [Eleusine coracana subsp. coracana]|uniref:Uncharacterized protein n=1 Tax=Eleusine coracana subsp. coracana TaxID=191504 RepID=A0AAV5E6W2_ELECO|nr:hypothetical protein PR202_gb05028 [Eleusine coracana subsp. coracana]
MRYPLPLAHPDNPSRRRLSKLTAGNANPAAIARLGSTSCHRSASRCTSGHRPAFPHEPRICPDPLPPSAPRQAAPAMPPAAVPTWSLGAETAPGQRVVMACLASH